MATEGKEGRKRVSLPSLAGQAELMAQLLEARCGGLFRRGFRLRAIGSKLYVQLSGIKAPLHLGADADLMQVQERALALRRFLQERGGYDSAGWRQACGMGGGLGRGMNRDQVIERWRRIKLAEGVSADTIERHYLGHLRRLARSAPLSEASLLAVIERTDPLSPTRKRVVAFLRQVCQACDAPWNGAVLDGLQRKGKTVLHRPQAFFTDEQILKILEELENDPPWRRALALMAAYGLRPWEAWVAERRGDLLWIPRGKTNRHGTTPPREVPPCHPQWTQLVPEAGMPVISGLSMAGKAANERLKKIRSAKEGTSYGFRHAYARRLHSPEYRVTDTHAARFMGHTVAAHHKAYRSWMGEEDAATDFLNRNC